MPVPWWLIDSEREIAGMLADLKLALPSVQATADLNGSNFQGIRTQFGSDRVDIQFHRGVCPYPMRVSPSGQGSLYTFAFSPRDLTAVVQKAYTKGFGGVHDGR